MINDRAANIRIGDQEYQLILTTRATKKSKRYGGLANLGDKLMQMKTD